MWKSKILSVLLIFCLTFVILSPAVYAAQDDGNTSAKGHKGQSSSSISGGSGHGGAGGGKGKGGSGKDHSTLPSAGEGDEHEHEDGEATEGGKGKGADKKGAVGRGGQGKGGINGGAKKGASKKEIGGTITLEVTVEGLPEGQEVDVTLFREGIPNTAKTVDGIATIYSEASGDCVLVGQDVPGFTTPEMAVSLTGNEKVVKQTLVYQEATIPVTGVTLNKTELELIKGYTKAEERTLKATVKPANANNQGVSWSSNNSNVAIVHNGLVEGKTAGQATITATTFQNSKSAQCNVTVLTIETLNNPEPIEAIKNELVVLPKTVVGNLDNSSQKELEVVWKKADGTPLGSTFRVPMAPEDIPTGPPEDVPIGGNYTIELLGYVNGCETPATLQIEVNMQGKAVPVEGVNLNPNSVSIQEGSNVQLTANINPSNATTKEVIWTSSNPTVAIVDQNGKVAAISRGMAVISVETIDGAYKAYCQVSVGLVPEISYIFPSLEEGEISEHFGGIEEVYINVKNLVEKLNADFEATGDTYPAEGIKYYVMVRDVAATLGNGEVVIKGDGTVVYADYDGNSVTDENEFNLYAVTQFAETESYSSRYFVSMSQFDNYPKDDEKTLMTNFMGGTSTPTIPPEDVVVTVDVFGDNASTDGIIFLLCREEMDDNDRDGVITWKDYYGEPISAAPYPLNTQAEQNAFLAKFVDEVKMIGVANAEGDVVWITPRETLKLGGYLLLQVTPNGYQDNLNLINPESEDGELYREVHLMRDGSIERNVINTYIGR